MTKKNCANAADLAPLAEYLEENSGHKSVARVFNAQGIPLDIIGLSDIHLPYADFRAVYERAARDIGDPLLGAHCGMQWGPEQLGPLGEYGISAPTLGRCLKRLIAAIHLYESGSSGSLVRHGDWAVFSYFQGFDHAFGRNHFSDANLGAILNVMRYYIGPDWRPHRIGIDSQWDQFTPLLEELYEAPIDCDERSLKFAFPVSDLDTRNPFSDPADDVLTLSDVGLLLDISPPESVIDLVNEVVRMRLLGGLTDVEGAAQHLHMGVRSLQRQLSDEGKNYRTIVNEARCKRAVELIVETEISITEIALSLGYDHIGSFTRAFTLHYGQRPSEVRSAATIKNAA